MPSRYQSLLLNDLHEYFPDILYRPGRFQSVGDLLQYIGDVARQNPYDQLRAEYERANPLQGAYAPVSQGVNTPVLQGANAPASHGVHTPVLHSRGYIPSVPRPVQSVPVQSAPLMRSVAQTSSVSEEILDSLLYGSRPVNITSSLLSTRPVRLPFASIASNTMSQNNLISNFINELLQPSQDLSSLDAFLNQTVVVHPSEEEIDRASFINCYNPQPYDNCAICQDAMEEGQAVRIIRYCSHKFHQECIDTWFQSHVTCPTCRHDIRGAIEQ